ncbi:tetratricopeptide repeat protein [Candidatus Odyssella thessalonicensis]|uniref:tetratricopeptide repeat protein n=1 Tax=Candidatus Odyssella thessalonicensis TaxID=84647 RepID=UPI000225A95A|nr:sel1 repeat family protein [Candidatus Odyssella thessalonicensis]
MSYLRINFVLFCLFFSKLMAMEENEVQEADKACSNGEHCLLSSAQNEPYNAGQAWDQLLQAIKEAITEEENFLAQEAELFIVENRAVIKRKQPEQFEEALNIEPEAVVTSCGEQLKRLRLALIDHNSIHDYSLLSDVDLIDCLQDNPNKAAWLVLWKRVLDCCDMPCRHYRPLIIDNNLLGRIELVQMYTSQIGCLMYCLRSEEYPAGLRAELKHREQAEDKTARCLLSLVSNRPTSISSSQGTLQIMERLRQDSNEMDWNALLEKALDLELFPYRDADCTQFMLDVLPTFSNVSQLYTAQIGCVIFYLKTKHYPEGLIEELIIRANQDNDTAQYLLGLRIYWKSFLESLCCQGKFNHLLGTTAEADIWLEKAANKGNLRALWQLGRRYEKDPSYKQKSIQWLKILATQGHYEAARHLSGMYRDRFGQNFDLQKADYWRDRYFSNLNRSGKLHLYLGSVEPSKIFEMDDPDEMLSNYIYLKSQGLL